MVLVRIEKYGYGMDLYIAEITRDQMARMDTKQVSRRLSSSLLIFGVHHNLCLSEKSKYQWKRSFSVIFVTEVSP